MWVLRLLFAALVVVLCSLFESVPTAHGASLPFFKSKPNLTQSLNHLSAQVGALIKHPCAGKESIASLANFQSQVNIISSEIENKSALFFERIQKPIDGSGKCDGSFSKVAEESLAREDFSKFIETKFSSLKNLQRANRELRLKNGGDKVNLWADDSCVDEALNLQSNVEVLSEKTLNGFSTVEMSLEFEASRFESFKNQNLQLAESCGEAPLIPIKITNLVGAKSGPHSKGLNLYQSGIREDNSKDNSALSSQQNPARRVLSGTTQNSDSSLPSLSNTPGSSVSTNGILQHGENQSIASISRVGMVQPNIDSIGNQANSPSKGGEPLLTGVADDPNTFNSNSARGFSDAKESNRNSHPGKGVSGKDSFSSSRNEKSSDSNNAFQEPIDLYQTKNAKESRIRADSLREAGEDIMVLSIGGEIGNLNVNKRGLGESPTATLEKRIAVSKEKNRLANELDERQFAIVLGAQMQSVFLRVHLKIDQKMSAK